MTDKKYTDEDTISSLELIATTRNCNECKIRNCKWGTCNCEQITANAALDLIKPQKIEIERLRKEVNLVSIQFQDLQERYEEVQTENENLKVENQSLRSAANSLKMHYEEAQAEVKRLEKETKDKERAYNDEFCLRKEWQTKCRELLKEKQTVKSEAYKEFAEKLKEFMHNKFKDLDEYEFEYITERDIDNFCKEIVKALKE